MSSIKVYLFISDCTIHCDLKVIKKFCDQPNFKVNKKKYGIIVI